MNEKTIEAKIEEQEPINGVVNFEALRGPNGFSAYELYVKNLPDGETPLTELEWLENISKINYYRQYKQTFITTDENTTIIPININAYNETCLLEAFLNGLRLDNTEYSVNNTTKQIELTNAIGKDQTIHLIVSKTIVSTAENFDLLKGEKGENGLDGQDGADGLGVPVGGTTGQVLAKKTNTDNDTEWIDPPAGTGGGSVTGDTYPIGSITAFAGSAIPANWLLCNGEAVSRTTYADLFTVIGTTYGAGDGSTTFNLPDLRGRVAVGVDSTDTNLDALGKTYGEKEVTLTVGQLPKHDHDLEVGTNDASDSTGRKARRSWDGGAPGKVGTEQVGDDQPHNNMQPSVAQNFIIKASQSAGLVANVVDNVDSTSITDALSAKQGKILNDKINQLSLNVVVDYTFEDNNTCEKSFDVNLQPNEHYKIRIVGGLNSNEDVYLEINNIKTNYYQTGEYINGSLTAEGTLSKTIGYRSNKTGFYYAHSLRRTSSIIEGDLCLQFDVSDNCYYPVYQWQSKSCYSGAQFLSNSYGRLITEVESITTIKFWVSNTNYFRKGTRIQIIKDNTFSI